MEIGKNIARLRREQGLTQEQLGQLLGVSGQAVSKWEKGGMPDAELLPAVADRLGVTIDTLYGRASEPTENLAETLNRWLGGIPAGRRMGELFRLLCSTFQHPYYTDNEVLGDLLDSMLRLPVKSCYSTDFVNRRENRLWMRSEIIIEEGIQLGVVAEDFPMFLLMPEPEDGYEANFGENEAYRRLFAALALPGALELLRCLYGRKRSHYSVDALAKLSGLEHATLKPAVVALEGCAILRKTTVETADESLDVYELNNAGAFVPFLLFARWLSDTGDAYMISWHKRDRPLLRAQEAQHE